MNLNKDTQALTETAIITSLMVIFGLVGLYFFNIIVILYPIPFIVLGVRHGTRYNILSLAISSLILGIFTNIILGIFLFVFFGFMAITLSYMLKRKFKASQILLFTAGGLFICILLTLALFNLITGTSLLSDIQIVIDQIIEISYDEVKDMGFSNYEQEEIKEMIKAFYEYFILLMPFMIISGSLFVAYINFWLSGVALRRLGNTTIEFPKFKIFSLPSNIILGTVVIIIGTILIRYLEMLYYETILLNVVALLIFVFFLQGLAVLVFFLDKLKINKFFKLIFLVLAIINVFLIILIAIAGFVDALLDFRKIRTANKP